MRRLIAAALLISVCRGCAARRQCAQTNLLSPATPAACTPPHPRSFRLLLSASALAHSSSGGSASYATAKSVAFSLQVTPAPRLNILILLKPLFPYLAVPRTRRHSSHAARGQLPAALRHVTPRSRSPGHTRHRAAAGACCPSLLLTVLLLLRLARACPPSTSQPHCRII